MNDYAELLSTDRKAFAQALTDLRGPVRSNPNDARVVLMSAVKLLDANRLLSQRERAWRISRIVEEVRSAGLVDQAALAHVAAKLTSAGRNAVLSSIDPEHRALAFAADAIQAPKEEAQGAGTASRHDAIPTTEKLGDCPWRTVLLIGTEQEHRSNIDLLKPSNFTPLRMEWDDAVEMFRRDDFCGVVVGASGWDRGNTKLNSVRLKSLLEISTFLFVRVDVSSLDEDNAKCLRQRYQESYCREDFDGMFCQGNDCRITTPDIGALERLSKLIENASDTRFRPGELTDVECLLVRMAAIRCLQGRRQDAHVRLEEVRTSFFADGKSTAKTVSIVPCEKGAGFVLKVDSAASMRSEMGRYSRFIAAWDGGAKPEFYFHGDRAAVLFSLVDARGSPSVPAPSLENRVSRLLNSELGTAGDGVPNESDLVFAVGEVVRKLAALNERDCDSKGFGYSWIAGCISETDNRGIKWQIPHVKSCGLVDVTDTSKRATKIVAPHEHAATCHGDAHLRNVLLRDDRDPYLIDFGKAGPGHPCYDLVFFECAVMFRCFRSLCTEERTAELIRAITISGINYCDFERDFPDLRGSVGNRIAVKASIAARDAALRVCRRYSCPPESYVAMKFLAGAYSLLLTDQQSLIARATVAATASSVHTT